MKWLFFTLMALGIIPVTYSQTSAAAQNRTEAKFGENVSVVRQQAPYKYDTQVLYFAESWLVEDGNMLRKPTEVEIAKFNVEEFENKRSFVERVSFVEPVSGLHITLLSMDEFVETIKPMLPADVLKGYEDAKANKLNTTSKKGE